MAFFRSIRFRIATWNSLAVAAIAITALLGVRQSVRWTLNREVDRVLIEDGREVNLTLTELGRQGLDAVTYELRRKAAGHAQHRWFIRLYGTEDTLLWDSDPTGASPRPTGQERLATVGEHRVYRVDTPGNQLGVERVELGSSLSPLWDDLNRIDQIVGGASCLLALLSPVCGYALSGLATRDLARMTDRAARLSPTDLGDRLPERGVGDELDRLAQNINGLLDRIAEFIAEKREFLANAAHELRSPISAIRGSAEVALSRDRTGTEYRELLEDLIEDMEPLQVLVNQILLISEAAATDAASSRATVSLSDLAKRSVEMFRGVAESRGVELTASIADGVFIDGVHSHLSQAVSNLIDNALKYTPEGGSVRVTLGAGSGGAAKLSVSDTGIGIDGGDLSRVFDRFFRTDRSRARDGVGGSGLGLSICRTIVESHNGRVRCESTPGKGSLFEVVLPVSVGTLEKSLAANALDGSPTGR